MDNQAFIETRLNSWPDLLQLPTKFMDMFVFRGQGSSKWELSTSLERSMNRFYPSRIDTIIIPDEERHILKEFKWKYPLYEKSCPHDNDLVEWLTILQHYSAPTRLLDVSNSLFVAAYFALADYTQDDCSIWAINKHVLNSKVFNKYIAVNGGNSASQQTLDAEVLREANDILINKSFDKKCEPLIYLVKPTRSNQRLSRQQGAFLMPTNIQLPFSEHLKSYVYPNLIPIEIDFDELIISSKSRQIKQHDIAILKITIPHKLYRDIGKSLRSMNITSEMLFPGVDGLCRSLSYLRFEGN